MTSLGRTVARWLHTARGSRSLMASGALVLLLTLFARALPDALVPGLSSIALLLLAVGLATLPREGSVAQANLAAALESANLPQRLARLLLLPVLLLLLLLPRLFLAAYGIPHMTPLTGLVLPALQRQVGLVFLALILLLPLLALRQARRRLGAPPVLAPNDLADDDPIHARRNLLLGCTALLVLVWLLLMRSFWQPFSLLAWPPSLASLGSVRGVTALAFTLSPPAAIFMLLSVHAELARLALRLPAGPRRNQLLLAGVASLVVLVGCAALHAYDLLWIAKYQAGSNV